MSDDLLASCPEWRAYSERLADAQTRQADILAQSEAAGQAYAQACAKHDLEVQRVVLEGGAVPDDPPRPSAAHAQAASLIQAEVFRIRDEATIVLAAVTDEVGAKAAAAAQTRASKVRKAAEVLESARAEQCSESAVVAKVRRARDLHAGVIVRPSEADHTRSDPPPRGVCPDGPRRPRPAATGAVVPTRVYGNRPAPHRGRAVEHRRSATARRLRIAGLQQSRRR